MCPNRTYSLKKQWYSAARQTFDRSRVSVRWNKYRAKDLNSPISIGGSRLNGSRTVYRPEESRLCVLLKWSSHCCSSLVRCVRTGTSSVSQNWRTCVVNSALEQQWCAVMTSDEDKDSAKLPPNKIQPKIVFWATGSSKERRQTPLNNTKPYRHLWEYRLHLNSWETDRRELNHVNDLENESH